MPESPSSQPFTSEDTLWSLIASRIASAATRLATNKRKAKSKNRAANQSMEIEWGADLDKLANLNVTEIAVIYDQDAIGTQPWQFLDIVANDQRYSHYFVMYNLKDASITIDPMRQSALLSLREGSPTAKDMEWAEALLMRASSIAEFKIQQHFEEGAQANKPHWALKRESKQSEAKQEQDDCPVGDLSWMRDHPELSTLRWLS